MRFTRRPRELPLLSLWVCVGALALPLSPAVAQDVVYDDGGTHVLSAYPASGDGSQIDVRDGPGADPTQLDVTIDDDRLYLYFDVHGSSTLNLLERIGYVTVETHDDSTAAFAPELEPTWPSNRFNAWDRSHLELNSIFVASELFDEATATFGADFTFAYFHRAHGSSETIMLDGEMDSVHLHDSAVMHVLGGHAGLNLSIVEDNAYLNVDGGSIHSPQVAVRGNGLIDIHSGTWFGPGMPHYVEYDVSELGMIRVFGTDFLINGIPVGPSDITALSGGALRTGILSGMLESGEPLSIEFFVTGGGILRLVPEPGTGVLLAAALAAAIAGHRPRRSAA